MQDLIIKVVGKVQGVWFRVKTKEQADLLNLSGFVQNEEGGSVYIEVSGKSKSVYKLIEWAQTGSEMADVKRVCISKNSVSHSGEFVIKR